MERSERSDHARTAPAQQRVQEDRAERRGADAAEREAAELQREVARAEHERDGRDDQVAVVGEVDLVVDPDLAPATAISPNTTIDTPPITGSGIAWITAPNFGEKPSTIAITAATTKTSVE